MVYVWPIVWLTSRLAAILLTQLLLLHLLVHLWRSTCWYCGDPQHKSSWPLAGRYATDLRPPWHMVNLRTQLHPFTHHILRRAARARQARENLGRQMQYEEECAPKPPFPRHFEVRWLNGQVLDLEHYSCRIYSTTDIAWVFQVVHSVVDWPPTYITLVIGNVHFQYTSRPSKGELYLTRLYYAGV